MAGYDQSGAPSNWNQWLSELQNQIWKAQHNEIVKPFYGTNKPLFPGGQPLPVGMNRKQWWSTHNVCVSVVLRCFGTKHSSRSGLLYGSLGLWKSTCKVWQQPQPDQNSQDYAANYYFWLFLKDKVLPEVLSDGNIVPPWPQDQSGQPCPKSNMQYVNGNPAYFDLPYTFTETVKPTSRAPYRGSQPRGSGSDQCQ